MKDVSSVKIVMNGDISTDGAFRRRLFQCGSRVYTLAYDTTGKIVSEKSNRHVY